jgi:hypothetical protein
MFRLFLRKKVLSAPASKAKGGKGASGPAGAADTADKRNRRVFARYSVDHKHLTLMNEQDILLIREISAKGFSTEVSPRGFERLAPGDVYEARIRYLGEIHDLEAKVAWKHDGFVGFEIVNAERSTLLFIKRLLRPIEIAASLQSVEASFLNGGGDGSAKTWYHGDEESDLYVWHHPDTNALKAWQLAIGEQYVEWSDGAGLRTGSLIGVQGRQVLMGANLKGLTHNEDAEVDAVKKQFAVDVIMALAFPVRDDILVTLTE